MAVAMQRMTVKATISKPREVKHKETGSPFSVTRTRRSEIARPGEFVPASAAAAAGASAAGAAAPSSEFDDNAFAPGRTTMRPSPKKFLRRGGGWGGKPTAAVAKEVKSASPAAALKPPPRAGATKPRYNPPNTRLRMMYDRGDLPCLIAKTGVRDKLAWSERINDLELTHFLPAFFDGLREEEEPYRFLAQASVSDVLEFGNPDQVSVAPSSLWHSRCCRPPPSGARAGLGCAQRLDLSTPPLRSGGISAGLELCLREGNLPAQKRPPQRQAAPLPQSPPKQRQADSALCSTAQPLLTPPSPSPLAFWQILGTIPLLIVPIKNALATRRHSVMCTTLKMLQKLIVADVDVAGGGLIGRALVPYYRQLLPVLAIFVNKSKNIGDAIDYSQRKGEDLGDLISDTLQLLETHGGDEALVNIQYLVPTYQSCMPAV